MAEIRPFFGLRYSPAHDLSLVTSPPYDVISPQQRLELLERSPHSIVAITLGPQEMNAQAWYDQAAGTKRDWIADGVIQRDSEPALYGYSQVFEGPQGTPLIRTGFMACVRLRPWGQGIHRHEFTRKGPRADRLALMKAMRANTSPVFGLFRDPYRDIARLLTPPAGAQRFSDDAVEHVFWPITDPTIVQTIVGAMAHRDIVIADGHHRYETALAYSHYCRQQTPSAGELASDYVMMYLNAIEDPGLLVLACHRVIHDWPVDVAKLLQDLSADFELLPAPQGHTLSDLITPSEDEILLGAILPDKSRWLLRLRDRQRAIEGASGHSDPMLATLDVAVLQNLVLEPHLGIDANVLSGTGHVTYTIDEDLAHHAVCSGRASAAFIINATTLEQVWETALTGVTLPQKSTYFSPKLQTGLVFNALETL